ncbi:GyrI-like domain-containing protein [Wukongibacter baidiensis]|uniref:MerR family transcriptional regulator n=1 Tax=Wukongibacter baidiensis TaxID=1723361 RepID=UPI003D7F736B
MLSIGEFSKICGVTTRTLRHYAEIGLIKPVHINLDNKYRFYDTSQLKDMLFIMRLKEYGFSLDTIAKMLEEDDDKLLLNEIKKQVDEMSDRISKYENLKSRMLYDLEKLEKGINIMDYINEIEVSLVEMKPEKILSIRQKMSLKEYHRYFGELYKLVEDDGLQIKGAPMAIYHDKEFDPESNDTELAVPVIGESDNTRILDGGLCAMAVHKGNYSGLSSAYAKLTQWLETKGYRLTSPPFEKYVKHGDINFDEFVTEVYFPVCKV